MSDVKSNADMKLCAPVNLLWQYILLLINTEKVSFVMHNSRQDIKICIILLEFKTFLVFLYYKFISKSKLTDNLSCWAGD